MNRSIGAIAREEIDGIGPGVDPGHYLRDLVEIRERAMPSLRRREHRPNLRDLVGNIFQAYEGK
jgi:hypothetical protein